MYVDGGVPSLAGRELNLGPSRVCVVYVHLVNICCQGSRGVCLAHGETTSCVDCPPVSVGVFRDDNLSQRRDFEGGSSWRSIFGLGKRLIGKYVVGLVYMYFTEEIEYLMELTSSLSWRTSMSGK